MGDSIRNRNEPVNCRAIQGAKASTTFYNLADISFVNHSAVNDYSTVIHSDVNDHNVHKMCADKMHVNKMSNDKMPDDNIR